MIRFIQITRPTSDEVAVQCPHCGAALVRFAEALVGTEGRFQDRACPACGETSSGGVRPLRVRVDYRADAISFADLSSPALST